MPVNIGAGVSAITWTQLTYTSSDVSGRGISGGWGIKEQTAGGDPDTVEHLKQGLRARLEEVDPTPTFPTEVELGQRVRRLSYRELGGFLCLWHTVAAGADASGRPSNVFIHAVATSAGGAFRPAASWRSPSWLVPHGPHATAAARLGRFESEGTIDPAGVLAFLTRDESLWARRVEWLLAAVSGLLSRRVPSIALVVDSDDDAAWLLGAVSYLTSAAVAQKLAFSTYERAHTLQDFLSAGPGIACVPRADLDEFRELVPGDVLVLDSTWSLDPPEVEGGDWVTPLRQSFPSDPAWQDALLDLVGIEGAEQVLAELDDHTSEADAGAVPVWWPLTRGLLKQAGDTRTADAATELANRPLMVQRTLRGAPRSALASLPVDAWLGYLRRQTPDDVAGVVKNAQASHALQVRLAMVDLIDFCAEGWRRGDRMPAVDPRLIGSLDTDQVQAALQASAASVGDQIAAGGESAVGALRLLTLVRRLGVDDQFDGFEEHARTVREELAAAAMDPIDPDRAKMLTSLLEALHARPAVRPMPAERPAAPGWGVTEARTSAPPRAPQSTGVPAPVAAPVAPAPTTPPVSTPPGSRVAPTTPTPLAAEADTRQAREPAAPDIAAPLPERPSPPASKAPHAAPAADPRALAIQLLPHLRDAGFGEQGVTLARAILLVTGRDPDRTVLTLTGWSAVEIESISYVLAWGMPSPRPNDDGDEQRFRMVMECISAKQWTDAGVYAGLIAWLYVYEVINEGVVLFNSQPVRRPDASILQAAASQMDMCEDRLRSFLKVAAPALVARILVVSALRDATGDGFAGMPGERQSLAWRTVRTVVPGFGAERLAAIKEASAKHGLSGSNVRAAVDSALQILDGKAEPSAKRALWNRS